MTRPSAPRGIRLHAGEFPATLVAVHTDEGLVGYGSGDTMDGFEAYRELFIGTDPLQIVNQVRRIETIGFHGGRYWPLEAAVPQLPGLGHHIDADAVARFAVSCSRRARSPPDPRGRRHGGGATPR